MPKYEVFRAEDLKSYMVRFFTRLGVPEQDAGTAAEILLTADLRGVESHGIVRLDSYYGRRLRKGLVNPLSPVSIVNETACTLALDGGNGLGLVVGKQAMQRTIEKAQASGVAITTVRNSNHYGIAGYYAMMALPEGMIGISFTNSQPLVAPTYGRKALLGTNPIAVAVPAGMNRPYVLDMATSIVPIGRVTIYEKAGLDIPVGWGINASGVPTANPAEVTGGGALMPLGGTDLMRGYKGYGLSLMVDIFSGILAGSGFGPHVAPPGETQPARVGHFFMAVQIEAFRPLKDFVQDMDTLLDELKNSPHAEGQERIYIHGEKEFERSERHLKQGVPVLDAVVKGLKQSGEEVGLPFDLTPVGSFEGEE